MGLPDGVLAMSARGGQWTTWVDGLAAIAQRLLDEWDLHRDGDAIGGSASLLLPVRTLDSVAAILKISFPAVDSEHEHLVLRKWAGDGAVRLLKADPRHRAVLLERLRPRTLATVPEAEACETVAGLYRRLHVTAMPQLSTVTAHLTSWIIDFEQLPRSAPLPRRLVEQAIGLGRDLAVEPRTAAVLHGDLHYGSVHGADRAPWLAIAPKPVNGDVHFELGPMLWHRWDELTGNVRDGVRRRLHTLVDAAGFDEDRARAWVIVRAVHEATRALAGTPSPDVTRFVALAKAVQD